MPRLLEAALHAFDLFERMRGVLRSLPRCAQSCFGVSLRSLPLRACRLQGPKRWQLAVRVIFAGKVLSLGGECGGKTLCDWADWRSFLEGMVPSRDECPEFYAAWPPPPGG